ncbi:hypothetical protein COCCADRAFT_26984 [Bipolaris zeicola 26-R-13]|uniref:Uncharacterized protein n=1 Tax=Cochliobolus carbonum (strain 26-R-13) TaxID=930089 RepID=W6YAM1_COCC2|nr:uncharacterized protein COCCADRAFT_26984 [Bipolaris zeicola 26-R-13]EUC32519.1 hypothetical protein COCCADRAFT_26984 [Bipolaris zeicola 26-R-13]
MPPTDCFSPTAPRLDARRETSGDAPECFCLCGPGTQTMSAQALNPKHQPARLPAARNWACSYPATADTSPSSRGLAAAAAANQARHTGTGTAIGATQSHSALRPGATTADLPRLRRRRACDRAVLATTLAEPLQPSPELSQRARAASSWHDAALGARVMYMSSPKQPAPTVQTVAVAVAVAVPPPRLPLGRLLGLASLTARRPRDARQSARWPKLVLASVVDASIQGALPQPAQPRGMRLPPRSSQIVGHNSPSGFVDTDSGALVADHSPASPKDERIPTTAGGSVV